MPLSGLIGAGAQDAFQQLVQQRLIEEERRQAQAQREYENALRLQQIEEARVARAADIAYRERTEKRDIEREKYERTGKTLANLMLTHDPTTGAPLVVPPEVAAATAGTEFAPLIEQRQIPAGLTSDEMEAEVIPARTQAQLRKTAAMRTAEEAETKKRQTEAALQGLIPTLAPPAQRLAQLGGAEALIKGGAAGLKTTPELETEREQEFKDYERKQQIEAKYRPAPQGPEDVVITTETGPHLLDRRTGITRPVMGPGGQPIGATGAAGRVPAQLMRSVEALGNISTALDRIRETSKAINTEEGVMARATGLMARGKQMAGYNPELVRMDAATKGRLMQFARALGEVGVLSNQDVSRMETLMPTVMDTRSEAEAKIGELEFIFDSAKDRVREIAESQGIQLPAFMKGPGQEPPAQMGPPAPSAGQEPPAGAAPGRIDLRYNPQTKRYERVP